MAHTICDSVNITSIMMIAAHSDEHYHICTSIVYRLYCSLSILCTGCACQLIIKENDDDDDDDDDIS